MTVGVALAVFPCVLLGSFYFRFRREKEGEENSKLIWDKIGQLLGSKTSNTNRNSNNNSSNNSDSQ